MKFLQDMGTNFFYSVGIKFFEDVGTKFFQDVGKGPTSSKMWGGDHPMAGGGRVMTAMTNRRMRVKCPETHFLSHPCSR